MVVNNATIENLRDAGCNDSLIDQFIELTAQERLEARMQLLAQHRSTLLDQVHINQKRIDRLDYLVYRMEKGKQEGTP